MTSGRQRLPEASTPRVNDDVLSWGRHGSRQTGKQGAAIAHHGVTATFQTPVSGQRTSAQNFWSSRPSPPPQTSKPAKTMLRYMLSVMP